MFQLKIKKLSFEPLERLDFFYQILIIIGLMAVFLIIEVYWGFGIISRSEKTTADIYEEIMEGMSLLQESQSRLNQLQVAYLNDIESSSNVAKINYQISLLPTFERVSSTLKLKYPETGLSFDDELVQLNRLMKEPVNRQNYVKLDNIISSINLKINSLTVIIQYTTADSMLGNKKFITLGRNNITKVLFLGAIIVTSMGLLFAFMATRRREKAHYENLQAEYNSLQAQMNPHFLYNTLETVNSLAKINQQHEIVEIVNALARILRTSIRGKNAIIRLEEEIKYTKDYLYIQQVALGDRIQIEYDIDEDVLDCNIPKLILQPIIENAIVHGIEGMKTGGLIVISAYKTDGLLISVSDNGRGMESSKINQILNGTSNEEDFGNHTRLGIRSVDKRIKILYGEKYGLKISSEPEQGTKVELLIPFHKGSVSLNVQSHHRGR